MRAADRPTFPLRSPPFQGLPPLMHWHRRYGKSLSTWSILQPDGIGWRRMNAAKEIRREQRGPRSSERPLLQQYRVEWLP